MQHTIEPFTQDDLAGMSEEELRIRVQQVRGWIESDRRKGFETQALEVEHCYLAEELKLRDIRRRAHEDWLRRNPELDTDFYS